MQMGQAGTKFGGRQTQSRLKAMIAVPGHGPWEPTCDRQQTPAGCVCSERCRVSTSLENTVTLGSARKTVHQNQWAQHCQRSMPHGDADRIDTIEARKREFRPDHAVLVESSRYWTHERQATWAKVSVIFRSTDVDLSQRKRILGYSQRSAEQQCNRNKSDQD